MTRASALARRTRRVVTRLLIAAPLVALSLAPEASRAQAPVELTVNSSMVKGAAGAAVTIIEFSDYQ